MKRGSSRGSDWVEYLAGRWRRTPTVAEHFCTRHDRDTADRTIEVIEAICEELECKREELAEKLEISSSTLSRVNPNGRDGERAFRNLSGLEQRALMFFYLNRDCARRLDLRYVDENGTSAEVKSLYRLFFQAMYEDVAVLGLALLERDGSDSTSYGLIANFVALSLVRLDRALDARRVLEDSIGRGPADEVEAVLHANLAGVMRVLGDLQSAHRHAAVATEKAPQHPTVWLVRLCGGSMARDEDDCRESKERYLALRAVEIGRRNAERELRKIMEVDRDFRFAYDKLEKWEDR